MEKNKAYAISLLALFLLAFELFVYSFTKMHSALRAGTLTSIIAYSFLWLMALTGSIGVSLPLGILIENKAKQQGINFIVSMGLVVLLMVSFTTVVFMKASSTLKAAGETSLKEQKGHDLSMAIEFSGSEVKETGPDSIEIELKFKNIASEDITELDYVFIAVEDINIFYRIKIREAVYLPSKGIGSTKLNWQRSKLKNPELYDKIKKANADKTLHVFAKPTKITMVNGSVIGD